MLARRPAAFVLAALLAACGDPSVQVNFEVPEQYRGDVETVELHVVEPPVGDDAFSCEDIAFQTVSADTVRLKTVKEFVERDGEHVDLTGIPREGTKLFFIEGLDDQQLPVVAACAPVELVDEDITIDLVGEPTTVVVLPTLDPGEPFTPGEDIRIGVVDFDGIPLGSIEVHWTTTGPGGQQIEGNGETSSEVDSVGTLDIPPAFPDRPGPAALDVRGRWMRTDPGPLLSFNMPDIVLSDTLPGTQQGLGGVAPGSLYAVGRIGPNGEIGFAALGPSDTPLLGRELYIAYYDATQMPPFRIITPGTITGALAIGLIERDGIDHPVTLTSTQWIEIEPTGVLVPQALPSPESAAVAIMPVGSCDGSSSGNERILVQHGAIVPVLRVYDSDGQIVADSLFSSNEGLTRPMAAGCVDSVEAGVNRTAIYELGTLSQAVVTEMDSGRQGVVPALRNAVGFSPGGEVNGPRLLATELSLDGTTISRYRLQALGDVGATTDKVDADPTVSLPQSMTGGHLDDDDFVDVIAALPFGTNGAGAPQIRVLMAMGATISGGDQRLVGLSSGFDGQRVALWVVDFDENGIDDILIGSETGFTVLHMGEP